MNKLRLKTSKGDNVYDIKDLDFTNVICDMEDMGVEVMGNVDSKMMSFCRAIIAVFTGTKDKNDAGKMLTEHIKNGGTLEEIYTLFKEAMIDAGFGETTEEPATEEVKEKEPEKK